MAEEERHDNELEPARFEPYLTRREEAEVAGLNYAQVVSGSRGKK